MRTFFFRRSFECLHFAEEYFKVEDERSAGFRYEIVESEALAGERVFELLVETGEIENEEI